MDWVAKKETTNAQATPGDPVTQQARAGPIHTAAVAIPLLVSDILIVSYHVNLVFSPQTPDTRFGLLSRGSIAVSLRVDQRDGQPAPCVLVTRARIVGLHPLVDVIREPGVQGPI